MGRFARPEDVIATEHPTVTEMRKRLLAAQDVYAGTLAQIDNQLKALIATDPSLLGEAEAVQGLYAPVIAAMRLVPAAQPEG